MQIRDFFSLLSNIMRFLIKGKMGSTVLLEGIFRHFYLTPLIYKWLQILVLSFYNYLEEHKIKQNK